MGAPVIEVGEVVDSHGYYTDTVDPDTGNGIRQDPNFVCSTQALLDTALLATLRVRAWQATARVQKQVGTYDDDGNLVPGSTENLVFVARLDGTDGFTDERQLIAPGSGWNWAGTASAGEDSDTSDSSDLSVTLNEQLPLDNTYDTKQFRFLFYLNLGFAFSAYGVSDSTAESQYRVVGDDYNDGPSDVDFGGALTFLGGAWNIVGSGAYVDIVDPDPDDPDDPGVTRFTFQSATLDPAQFWAYDGRYDEDTGEPA